MFSKTALKMAALLPFLTLSACSDFIQGQKREPEVIELSDARFACLKTLPQNLKAFSVGEAAPEKIRSSVDCVREALLYFQKKTYGSTKDAYTVEEMRRFFGKYFLKENNVTPEFAQELMKLKKALLGGSDKYLTKLEIVAVVDLFATVRDQAIDLNPHIRVLIPSDDKKKNWEEVASAVAQLRKSVHPILEKSQIAKSEYSFADLKKILEGFSTFVKGSEKVETYDRYAQQIPLIEAVKNILMGQKSQVANMDDWKETVDNFLDLYELALQYKYVIKDLTYQESSEVRQLSQFIAKGLAVINTSPQMRNKGYIPLEDIDNLIDQVLTRAPQFQVRPSSVKEAYRWTLVKILEPSRKGDSRGLVGLEAKHMLALNREFSIWRMYQGFIDQALATGTARTQSDLVQTSQNLDIQALITRAITTDPLEERALLDAWADFKDVLKLKNLVRFADNGTLLITYQNPQPWQYSWSSMTKLNTMLMLSRVMMNGYADNLQSRMSQNKLVLKNLIAWYNDFNNLGLDLKAFDPRANSEDSGNRSFKEANFFAFNGNGDEEMNFRETLEYVSGLFSSGLLSSQAMADMALAQNCAMKTRDVFSRPFLSEECLRKQLHVRFAQVFANLPGMVDYVHGLSEAQWNEFFGYLKAASRMPDQQEGLMDTANVRTMATVIHYMEGVILNFDVNQNGGLSAQEIYAASPRFIPFFRKLNPKASDWMLTQGFAYLLYRGEVPGLGGLAGFQFEKWWGLGEVHRMELARLFAKLPALMKGSSQVQRQIKVE